MGCKMILYVSCVSLAIAFSASDAAAVNSVVLYSSSNSGLSGFVDKEREKRTILGSAAARGLKALEILLRKTRPVKDEKRFYKYARFGDEYEKTGSFLSALNDFDSVYPKGVKEYILPKGNILKVGKVGDRTLYLKKHGAFGQPTLEILQNLGRPHEIRADLIIYTGMIKHTP